MNSEIPTGVHYDNCPCFACRAARTEARHAAGNPHPSPGGSIGGREIVFGPGPGQPPTKAEVDRAVNAILDLSFRHADGCAVHSPSLRPCSCGLETRLRTALQAERAALRKALAELEAARGERDEAKRRVGEHWMRLNAAESKLRAIAEPPTVGTIEGIAFGNLVHECEAAMRNAPGVVDEMQDYDVRCVQIRAILRTALAVAGRNPPSAGPKPGESEQTRRLSDINVWMSSHTRPNLEELSRRIDAIEARPAGEKA